MNFLDQSSSSIRDNKSKECLYLISYNPIIDNGITQKVLGLITRDLGEELNRENISCEDILIILKTLSNLTCSPCAINFLSDHPQLIDFLMTLKSFENQEINLILEGIDNNLIGNKSLLEILITNNPTYLKNIIAESVHKRNVPLLINLFDNSVRKLLDASIVNQTNLHFISEKFCDIEMINKQIKEVLDCEMIDNMSDEDDDVRMN